MLGINSTQFSALRMNLGLPQLHLISNKFALNDEYRVPNDDNGKNLFEILSNLLKRFFLDKQVITFQKVL